MLFNVDCILICSWFN